MTQLEIVLVAIVFVLILTVMYMWYSDSVEDAASAEQLAKANDFGKLAKQRELDAVTLAANANSARAAAVLAQQNAQNLVGTAQGELARARADTATCEAARAQAQAELAKCSAELASTQSELALLKVKPSAAFAKIMGYWISSRDGVMMFALEEGQEMLRVYDLEGRQTSGPYKVSATIIEDNTVELDAVSMDADRRHVITKIRMAPDNRGFALDSKMAYKLGHTIIDKSPRPDIAARASVS